MQKFLCSYQKGVFMNKKNQELLFNDDEDMTAVVTLTDEDGNDIDAEIVAAIEVKELNKEYVAVLPQQATEDFEEGEALILEYTGDENGDPEFSPVEDDEFEIVSGAFNQFFESMDDDDEDDDEPEEFLDDIGDILPGISIKKD